MLVSGDKEACGTASRVEHDLILLRSDNLNDKIDNVARSAKLPGIALRSKDGKQILKGIAKTFTMVVGELIDNFEKGFERLGIAIGKISIFENIAEERRNARVFGHLRDALSIEIQHFVTTETGAH